MRQMLPDAVRDSTRKGLQSSDLEARLIACQDDLLEELDRLAGHALVREWIDLPRLALSARAAIGSAAPSSRGTVDAGAMLRTLAAAMFIARHG
jgi:hypothetical protein